MATDRTFQDFIKDPQNLIRSLQVEHLEGLLRALVQAERLESLQVFVWHLALCLKRDPELEDQMLQTWKPTEESLAQLLEDAGRDEAQVVLSLVHDESSSKKHLSRLVEISDELGDVVPGVSKDPWEQLSRLPMVGLLAEQQLDQLIGAVAQGIQWKDPKEILDPDGLIDVDLESIMALAQARMGNQWFC